MTACMVMTNLLKLIKKIPFDSWPVLGICCQSFDAKKELNLTHGKDIYLVKS